MSSVKAAVCRRPSFPMPSAAMAGAPVAPAAIVVRTAIPASRRSEREHTIAFGRQQADDLQFREYTVP
jgi:hypothetical protein